MDKRFIQSVKELSILIIIGTIAIIVLDHATDIFSSPKIIEKEIRKEVIKEIPAPKKPSEFPDYNYFNDLDKIILATSCESWVKQENNGKNRWENIC